MPKTKFQGIIFSALMSVVMAYGMELYNIARKMGGISNAVYLAALKEASYMALIVFIVSSLIGNKVGKRVALRHVSIEKDNHFFVTLMISCCTVGFMCPAMSLVATLIFTGIHSSFLSDWFGTIAKNFPMALFWQLFFAGPVVRKLFKLIFIRKSDTCLLKRTT